LWTQLFSIITIIVAAFIVLKKFPPEFTDVKYISIGALLSWLIGDLAGTVNLPYGEFVNIFLQSTSISLLLIIFLIFIRQRKPVIFRYPYYMVFIPMLIPFTQLIVLDAQVIREIIFMTLQGVAILVYVLLSIGYSSELKNKLITIVGLILLVSGFCFYWILQDYFIVLDWAWGLTNSGGMIACIYSFSDLLRINENI